MPSTTLLSDTIHHILINHQGRTQLFISRYGPITLGKIKSSFRNISFLGANNSVQINSRNNSQIILYNFLKILHLLYKAFILHLKHAFFPQVICSIVISSKRLFRKYSRASVEARKCYRTLFVL